MPEYIDKEKLIRDLIDNRNFYPAIVKKAIENAPTEDVVPRSEVEKAKQDVAREIVETVEYYLKKHYYNFGTYTWWHLNNDIAELKKKYIGEGNERSKG